MEETFDTNTVEQHNPALDNPIRKTDNRLREEDLPGVSQDNSPLEIGADGLPTGWTPPADNPIGKDE